MDEDYGGSFISLTDDDGNEIEMEVLDTLEHDGAEYVLFLPADMDEDDPDYGYVILQVVVIDNEEQFQDVEDQELLQTVYEKFMERIFGDEE